jgi:hypothetical protein
VGFAYLTVGAHPVKAKDTHYEKERVFNSKMVVCRGKSNEESTDNISTAGVNLLKYSEYITRVEYL